MFIITQLTGDIISVEVHSGASKESKPNDKSFRGHIDQNNAFIMKQPVDNDQIVQYMYHWFEPLRSHIANETRNCQNGSFTLEMKFQRGVPTAV